MRSSRRGRVVPRRRWASFYSLAPHGWAADGRAPPSPHAAGPPSFGLCLFTAVFYTTPASRLRLFVPPRPRPVPRPSAVIRHFSSALSSTTTAITPRFRTLLDPRCCSFSPVATSGYFAAPRSHRLPPCLGLWNPTAAAAAALPGGQSCDRAMLPPARPSTTWRSPTPTSPITAFMKPWR